MFTVCPKCTLTLVVTTVDLRAGQGYVRCGRCANVFNALIALREGDPSGGTSDTATRRLRETAPRPPAEPALGSGVAMEPEPEPEPELEPEPEAAPEAEVEVEPHPESEAEAVSDEALEFDAIATDVSEIFITPSEAEHDTGSGSYESVVLGEEPSPPVEPPPEPPHETVSSNDWSLLDDEPVADDESIIEESPLVESEPYREPEPKAPDPEWVQEMFAEAEAEAERTRTGERQGFASLAQPEAESPESEYASEAAAEDDAVEDAHTETDTAPSSDTAIDPLLGPPVDPRPRWQYITGIVLLALLLVGQIVHHHRHSLVLSQSIGPLVSTIYGWFDSTPVPRWDLLAYDVKLVSAEAEPGPVARLRVRVSVQNSSNRVQPLPLLRLTLQDRFANPVATRDLEPSEYLPRGALDHRLLEPNQRIDTEVHVIDPGTAAVGYEIDACLRGAGNSIGCAHDARRRATT